MDGEVSTQIVTHLDAIGKMLAFLIIQDLDTTKDRIIRLHKTGLAPIYIAWVLGVKRNHVDVTLSNARKSGEI
ncbi:MAG: hypothetical protein ACFFER_15105 [Candidatus Thorarchaeota archaeon]